MSASNSQDVWAAACEPTSAGVRQGFFLHWNGQSWQRLNPPRIVHRDVCFSTIKVTSQEVIAVGTSRNGNNLTDSRPLIDTSLLALSPEELCFKLMSTQIMGCAPTREKGRAAVAAVVQMSVLPLVHGRP
jgi:hypothetical protein